MDEKRKKDLEEVMQKERGAGVGRSTLRLEGTVTRSLRI
jgi:hypothetical protein